MDINLSGDSFAFSDIVAPSHVSGLESFSEFETSFGEDERGSSGDDEGVEDEGTTQGNNLTPRDGNYLKSDSFSIGLQSLQTVNINQFWAAIESAKAQLGMPVGSDRYISTVQDESSLGILQLDSLQEYSGFGSGGSSADLPVPPEENHLPTSNTADERPDHDPREGGTGEHCITQDEDLPFSDEYNEALSLSQLYPGDRILEKRPDTGQHPDTFFNLPPEQDEHVSVESDGSTMGLSQDELRFMLQTRSGSGDGGELIDRVSLTSSISFIQSQTFPESMFSHSLSSTSRGLGSGMDSGSATDDDGDDDLGVDDDSGNHPPLEHDVGDGSNGTDRHSSLSVGRPGLEGANSETEDGLMPSRPSSDLGGSVAESIELRQSGEGDDVLPDLPGDGGGGGDGSSGHGSDDDQPTGSDDQSGSHGSTPVSSSSHGSTHDTLSTQSQNPSPSERELSSNRGPPVGHAASDVPASMVSPPQNHGGDFSNSTLDHLDALAASTPMVRQGQVAFDYDATPVCSEVSTIGSQYLLATRQDAQRVGTQWALDSSFHVSQALGSNRNGEDNDVTLTEMPSLAFETQGMTPRPPYFSEEDQEKISKHSDRSRADETNKLLTKLTLEDIALNRTMTPGGSAERMVPFSTPAPGWAQDSGASGYAVRTGFDSDSQIEEMHLPHNPFDTGDKTFEWNGVDDFEVEGDAIATLAADEESFKKEHQFDAPYETTTDINAHEWTIPDESHIMARPSLLREVGLSDPYNRGVSFGTLIAAGSEELGSLSNVDPKRARPHFGDGRSINTPSPQPPPKLMSRESIDQHRHLDAELLDGPPICDNTLLKQTNVEYGLKGATAGMKYKQKSQIPTVKKSQRSQRKRQESIRKQQLIGGTTLQAQKATLDEQFDKERMPRERLSSESSSHSSSSRSSAPSVIDNSNKIGAPTASANYSMAATNSFSTGPHQTSTGRSRSVSSNISSSPKQTAAKRQHKNNGPSGRRKKSGGRQNRAGSTGSTSGSRKPSDGENYLSVPSNSRQGVSGGTYHRVPGIQLPPSVGSDQSCDHFQSTQGTSSVASVDSSISSLLTSSSSLSSMTHKDLAAFIAVAINADPEHVRKFILAASKAKVQAKDGSAALSGVSTNSTSDGVIMVGGRNGAATMGEPSGPTGQTPERGKLKSLKPIASSSPHEITEAESISTDIVDQMVSPPTSALYESSALSPNSPDQQVISSYSIDSSVFVDDSPENVSVLERDTTLNVTTSKNTSLSPAPDPFSVVHLDPNFGKTYTIKGQMGSKPQTSDFDPLRKRANQIEQRLNHQSLSPENEPAGQSSDFQPVLSMTSDSLKDSFLESLSFDSAHSVLQSRSPYQETRSRHSWPKTGESPQSGEAALRGTHPSSSAISTVPAPITNGGSEYMQAVVVAVPQTAPSEVYPGISPVGLPPQFPAQANPFVPPNHAGYVPHSSYGQNINGPLSGTFPMPPIGFQQNSGPPSQNTVFGQGPTQVVQGQFHVPTSRYNPLGITAPALGPGTIPMGHQMGQVPNYGPLAVPQHLLQPYTVSAGIGPRLSTMTQAFSYQAGAHLAQAADQSPLFSYTTPPTGLLQLGQPLFGHDWGAGMDKQQPLAPQQSRGTAGSLSPVVIPGEVKLPAVCSVGIATRSLLTLHNSSSRWIYCMVRVAHCTVNVAQVTNAADNPFIIPSKLIINPHTTIQIEVIFKPKCAGLHKAQLHVTSSPVAPDSQQIGEQWNESLPSLVAVETVAELPEVKILSEDSQVVDFGEMVYSHTKHSRALRLINKGKAAVPIRLTITPNATSLHCFSFAKKCSAPSTTSESSSTAKGVLSIHKLLLNGKTSVDGALEPNVVWMLFTAPQTTDPGPSPLGLPDEFNARVDVEIDSDDGPIIGSVLLKATVGIARLHIPKILQALSFSGAVGQHVSRAIPLRNAGNIAFQVDLKVVKDVDVFTVTPTRTVLKPQQEVEVNVKFKPTNPDTVINSNLAMSILPDGPEYDVFLRGIAVTEPVAEESNPLLCNKTVVCWGGVAIGKAVQQKVVLKNNGTSSRKLKLQLSIQGHHPDFQLQNTFGRVDENSLASIVSLASKEELPVHVLFAPSSLGLISSALVIRTITGGTKSKVPLHGCGGTSNLVLVDTRKLSEGYVVNIGEVSLGKRNTVKVIIKNTGTRAAFVKAVCYSDIMSQTVYPPSHLSIAPNTFVLPERSSKQVVIVYQPLENDALNCRREVSTVATVAFYTGDEVIRQQYKRYLLKNDLSHSTVNSGGPLNGINFLTAFQDEDKIIEDVVYSQVPQWSQFFQGCVSRMLLMLVGSPPRAQENKMEANRSLDLVPMQGPTENGPLVSSVTLASNTETKDTDSKNPDAWTVLPEHLVLTASKTLSEKGTGRLQIINFSERPLMFEFTWPAHCLAITPDTGQVPPRSQVMVVMSPRPTLPSSGIELPWGATVYIRCDGTQKAVRVQIREEFVVENSPFLPGTSNLQALEMISGIVTPFTPALPSGHLPALIVKTKQIQFREALAGKESVSELVMENSSNARVTWDLSSVAPAYVKATNNPGDIFRTTYTAFSFHKRSGVAESRAVVKIPVKFQPRDAGQYSQFWDLKFKQDGFKRVHKQRIELTAQAVSKGSSANPKRHTGNANQALSSKDNRGAMQAQDIGLKNSVPDHKNAASDTHSRMPNLSQQEVTISALNRSKRSGKPRGVYVSETEVHFPLTSVGQTSEGKIKLCNDSSEICAVKVIAPQAPFSVANTKVSVRARRFVRLPVKFTPLEAGLNYESLLLFTPATDNPQQVTLYGRSAEAGQ